MQILDPLKQIPCFYHFTDTRNIPFIWQQGGLLSLALLQDHMLEVPALGGNDWSHEADKRIGLDRYVHLCFRNQHPMEYKAKKDGRIKDTIFLEISTNVLNYCGVLFTPDVSNKSGVNRYKLEQACNLIDFEVLYTRTNWHDVKIKTRLRNASKYEILVPNIIPLSMIRNLPNG